MAGGVDGLFRPFGASSGPCPAEGRIISHAPLETADVEALVAAGLDHHQAGRRSEAEHRYAEALAADPQAGAALYLMGILAFETGRAEAAVGWLERLTALKPQNLEAHRALATVHHWRGDHAAAAAVYRAVLALDPDHAEARVGLANVLREAGDPGALEAARAAVGRHADLAAAQSAFAAALAAAGQPLAAASAWREAVRLEPDNAASHVGLALALTEAGEARAALAAAERAVVLAPADAQAWFAHGAALAAAHRYAEAVVALRLSADLDPSRAAAQLALGTALAELEQVAEAEARLQAAIALDPTLAEAHASLGAVYLLADRPDAARAAYEAALAADPDLIAAHQSLAGLLADAGEAEAARRHRDRAYRQRNLFVEAAAEPEARVLILTTAEGGNVPFRHLLPKDRYTRLTWFVEYAAPGQGAELPAHDLVFNAIGDPDLAGPTAANVAAFREACRAPWLNAPEAVMRTARHRAPALLKGLADVVVPAVARLEPGAAAPGGMAFPALLRPIGSHGGKGLVRVETEAALPAGRPTGPAYLTAFHDFASADGYYRKYRMIFVDRVAYPYHLAIARDWKVHHGAAGMADDPARIAEELAFLADPEAAIGARALEAVRAIGRRLDLDYAGLDFAMTPDGQVLVFEANATMLVHPEPAGGPFAAKNPYVARILEAFAAKVARSALAQR